MFTPIVVVHGGAGDVVVSDIPAKLKGIKEAVSEGFSNLILSNNALDAAVAAVKSMENNPLFNAGTGSVLTRRGEVEMDAMVMDGRSLKMGSVTGVKNIQHPIELAKLVMDKSPYAFLSGPGANEFATSLNLPTVPAYKLVTETAIKNLENFLNKTENTEISVGGGGGTVGAVAIDTNGNVAAATSTGGIIGKWPGRVGDTPVVGAGTYADNEVGAVSATGIGELIMRVCLAHRIVSNIRLGMHAQKATEEALNYMKKSVGPGAGAITISSAGDIGIFFNSNRMTWGYKKGDADIEIGVYEPPKSLIEQ